MVAAAPRIHPYLIQAIARLDRKKPPIADTHRRVGALAAEGGLPRPNYEQVRTIVHLLREPDPRDSRRAELMIGLALQTKPAWAATELWR